MRKTLIFAFVMISLLSACGGPTATPDAMMGKPTEAMMEKPTEDMMMAGTATADAMMMHETPTPDDMMAKPTEDMMMAETATADAMMMHKTPTPDAMMMHDTPTPDAMMDKSTATPNSSGMMETPGWFGATLNNVNSGNSFAISDFKGKVVLVETMAVWCSNCKSQQAQIKALHEALGMPEDLVSISLDIDPNENVDDLKSYVTASGFDWMYAVAPAEVSRELSNLYGAEFLNPTSTPMLIIDRHGEVHPLPFGIKSADDLMKALEPFLKDKM